MAGFADPPTLPPAPSRRPLPNGPCNYRDASLGPCGCDQFWDKLSADLHDESTEHRPGSERSTWCVCGHHACFHLKASRAPERRAPSISVPLPSPHALCEGQCQTLPTAPCDAHAGLRLAAPGGPQSMRLERFNSQFTHSQRHLLHTSRVHESGRIAQSQDTPSQASTSGLPGIPSVCLLSHEQRPVANNEIRHGVSQSHHSVTGLGLSTMRLKSMCQVNRQQSPTPTIPDDINIAGTLQTNRNERDHSLTRANTNSPSRAILEHVLPFNRNIQLDIPGDTIPNTYNPEEYVQSTTEVATPSAGATPDLSAADRAVQEGKNLIDTLARMTSDMQPQAASSPDRPTNATMPTQLLLENSPSVPQEQLQNLLQTASPQGLQKLVSYLAPLHNLLNSIPNVANTMRDLGSRLDMLENGSFNYVQPEDLNQTLEMYEGRLIEVEHRVDEHEKMHQALDDHGSISSFSRRHIKDVNTSFGSNHSADSTTSSALILAAMDRKDTEMELEYIKQRLDVLEAAAPPTSLAPWEIEVVLLPWGPDLRGIWFSQDDPMHDVDRTTTQSSEEWTQARSSRTSMSTPMLETRRRDTDSSPYPGAPMLGSNSVLNQHESGWSSQDITNWASGSTDDWLFPKACGSNNLVYKRLQSRGFVRDITLRGASAKDVQETLSNAFSDVFDHLQYDDSDENPMIAAYPGLRASYIPLRKVLRESRLRFLTPAEMSSSAFWTAQFLASGVMMRVSGGKKRLYVTHREAYTQQVDRNEFVVMEQSWPELRQLPRYQPEKNSQTDGNDEDCQPHVPEADAKEACWQFVEAYDAPPASMHSSFGSNQSVQLSMRPAGRQWRRSITPSSILKKHTHPISPLSENHPRRPSSHRNRTVSASAMDTFPPSSAKRRYNGSPIKQSSAPQTVSRTPSLMPRLKRRRVTESASPRPQEDAREEPQVPIWTATPRRSREPPSPFYSSQHPLPRSYSDITSRPSQRSVTVTGKSTPFAYATPHSGPFTGGPGYSAYNNGGDTEPDDDDNAYNDDDGEQSWHGVTDGESVSSSVAGAAIGAQEGASFSGDDSGFGSDNDDDSDAQSEEDAEDHAQRQQDDGDEDEDDVFDSLLSVIED